MHTVMFQNNLLNLSDPESIDLKDVKNSFKVAKKQGIDTIIAAPKYDAEEMTIDEFLKKRLKAIEKIQAPAEEAGISILPGAEVVLTDETGKEKELNLLKIRGTGLLILKMPERQWEDGDVRNVERVLLRGIRPVIAHFNLYTASQKDTDAMIRLLNIRPLVAVDAETLGAFGMKGKMLDLFSTDNAHFLGSGLSDLKKQQEKVHHARKVLEKEFDREFLESMDEYAAEQLNLK